MFYVNLNITKLSRITACWHTNIVEDAELIYKNNNNTILVLNHCWPYIRILISRSKVMIKYIANQQWILIVLWQISILET